MNISVQLKHPEGNLVAELCREGGTISNYYGDDPLEWYIDAAWIENAAGEKLRDLTDDEMNHFQNEDQKFIDAAYEAFHDAEENYDPSP